MADEGRFTLTGGRDVGPVRETVHQSAVDRCPEVCAVYSDAVGSFEERLSGETDSVPGASLADKSAVDEFEESVTEFYDDVFTQMQEASAAADRPWNRFRECVRLLAEGLYLGSFYTYDRARRRLSNVEHARKRLVITIQKIREILQADQPPGSVDEGEQGIPELVERGETLASDAREEFRAAVPPLRRAHFYYVSGNCFQEEFDLETEEFDYVALDDDPRWHFQQLRNERQRLRHRIRWMSKDLERFIDTLDSLDTSLG